MRPLPEAGSPAWPMRILRPWLVATAGGLAIGASLLSFDSISFPSSYPESAPRAAVYDPAPIAFSPPPAVPASQPGPSVPAEATGIFAPAEPIAAVTDLSAPADAASAR